MDAIFLNSENSKTTNQQRLLLNLIDKIDLKRGGQGVVLSNLSIYYTWQKIKSPYKNNKFKIFPPTWNDKSELSGRSCSKSNNILIQINSRLF